MKKYIFIIAIMVVSAIATAQTNDSPYSGIAEYKQTSAVEPVDTLAEDTLAVDSVDTALQWPLNVQARLDRLLKDPMLETTQLGLMVYDLTADSTIYKYHERQTLRPASTMKLLTSIAAIDKLGGSYQFRTSLYYTGNIENETLTGDLYCVGSFDPRFNSDDMKAFVERIRRMGVDTIRGRIIADKSMKEPEQFGEGWCWDDDNPVLSPLLISKKDNFMERFVEELRDAGVTVDAPLTEGTLPNGAYILCSRFHTMDQVLTRMMKESDNLYAESMFYQLAAVGGNHPARASHARNQIKRLIQKVGLNPSAYKIADGSGLSLYNYVSAELETRLLRYAWRNSNISMYLMPALPVAGVDGTLKSRMKGPFTSGNVRAKTGTVTGISSLAGYCVSANGHELAFCIINQGVMNVRNGRHFQDKVCLALCQP